MDFQRLKIFAVIFLSFWMGTHAHAMDLTQCQLAEQALNTKQPQKAIGLYTRCLETGALNSKFQAFAYLNRGIAYRRIGNTDKAINDITEALKIAPRSEDALSERAIVLSMQGKLKEALVDFSKAISINPKYQKAVTNRGLVYEALGDKEKALKDFEAAYALGSRWQVLLDKLALYKDKGNANNIYEVAFPLPDDFKLAFKSNQDGTQMYQYVPKGQSLENWDRMFTLITIELPGPMPGIEKLITKNTINGYISQCSKAENKPVSFPVGTVPSYAELAYCDGVDTSKVPSHIHIRKNGFILVKSYTAEQAVYTFQYEWQSDTSPSSYIESSGVLKKDIMPLMTKSIVKLATNTSVQK